MTEQELRHLRQSILDPANNPVECLQGQEYAARAQMTSPAESMSCAAMALGGSLLIGFGLGRRSVTGLAIAALGGYLLYNGAQPFMGQCNVADAHEKQVPRDGLQDEIDEASWESFPASDPPSYSPTRA